MLYPRIPYARGEAYPAREIHEAVKRLCAEYQIEAVDLVEHLGEVKHSRQQVRVGHFDAHASEFVHQRMAEVLSDAIRERWPELFEEGFK